MKDFNTAAILCGGKSSRMGFDKCEIRVKNKLLIEIIAEQLEQIFGNIILISNEEEKFKHTKYKVVQDIIPNSGPMGGIHAALNYSDSKFVFVIACDMPVINIEYINYMIKLIKTYNYQGVAAYNSGFIEPLYAFYSKDMICTFENKLKNNNFKLLDVMNCCNIYYVSDKKVKEFSMDMRIFTNLNYKSDLSFLESAFTEE